MAFAENFLVNDLPCHVYWMNRQNLYLGCNKFFAHANGMNNPIAVSGKKTIQLPFYAKHKDLVEQIEKNNLSVLESGSPQLVEEYWLEDGKKSAWMVQRIPIVYKDETILLIIAFSALHFNQKNLLSHAANLQPECILENIVANMPGHVYWKDKDGVYLGCNDKQAKSLGLKHGNDVVGKTDFELPWSEDAAKKFRENDLHIMAKGKTELFEEPSIVDGKPAIVLSLKSPLKNIQANQIIGVMGISIDITSQKEVEKELIKAKEAAEAANKAKTEFLENMRHDIRTPLTGIVGFAEIIKSEMSEPKIKEYVDNLTASSNALLELLNAVLEAIAVNSGEVPILKKKFNLKEKLNSVILLNQAKAHEKNLDLLFEYDEKIPRFLIGDEIRLHRVALELVTNALNFTDRGHVRLSLHLAKDNEKDVIIKMIVEDTGIGIATEDQQGIYLQFKRVTPSYKGIYKGFGLGLFISKQFIDEMEGELYLESQVGVGSKFTAIIRLKKSLLDDPIGSEDFLKLNIENTAHLLKKSYQNDTNINLKKTSDLSYILIVEDSDIAARVLSNMLSGMNCQVDIADNGKTAVRMAEANQYDLIFMDIGLPDIDGYEVTKRIRLSELNKKHIPIIALTAHINDDSKQQCINIGMNALITKPLIKEKAEDILNSFIPYRKNKLKQLANKICDDGVRREDLLVFDISRVKELFVEKETVLEMIKMFFESLPNEVIQLKAAYNKKDWALISAISHKIRGGATYFSAQRLDQACLRLENYVRESQEKFYEESYLDLLNEISLLEKAIAEEILKIDQNFNSDLAFVMHID